jgi:hypothetical protein
MDRRRSFLIALTTWPPSDYRLLHFIVLLQSQVLSMLGGTACEVFTNPPNSLLVEEAANARLGLSTICFIRNAWGGGLAR